MEGKVNSPKAIEIGSGKVSILPRQPVSWDCVLTDLKKQKERKKEKKKGILCNKLQFINHFISIILFQSYENLYTDIII